MLWCLPEVPEPWDLDFVLDADVHHHAGSLDVGREEGVGLRSMRYVEEEEVELSVFGPAVRALCDLTCSFVHSWWNGTRCIDI